jgi:predicted phosphatase
MFIIDFDDTLFDTHSFKREINYLSEDLYKQSSRIKEFLFPEAVSFLEFLKQTSQPLILLSLGEASFQKTKIDISGISRFFDLVCVTADSKENAISQILNDFKTEADIWFINDKIEETKKVIQVFPHLKPILKMSPKFSTEEYESSLMPYFSTLILIQQYVEQQAK